MHEVWGAHGAPTPGSACITSRDLASISARLALVRRWICGVVLPLDVQLQCGAPYLLPRGAREHELAGRPPGLARSIIHESSMQRQATAAPSQSLAILRQRA